MDGKLELFLTTMSGQLKAIKENLEELNNFFHSIDELDPENDLKYQEELKKDGFHPPMG